MGLSLASNSRKPKIGSDPRNTLWANDTGRFGHQQMVRMGWQPGKGLGASVEGAKEHFKVRIKSDAKGLGHQKGQIDQPTGLDVFQRILGKLNGNEQEVEQQIERKERLTSGLYMHFVPGGVLGGTVKSKMHPKQARKQAEKQKRKAEKQAERLQNAKIKLAKAENAENDANSFSQSASTVEDTQKPVTKARGIRATRNRYIAMKKQATSDSQALKEILML